MRRLRARKVAVLAVAGLGGALLVSSLAFAGSSTENGVTQHLEFEFIPNEVPEDKKQGGALQVGVKIDANGQPPAAEKVDLDFDDDFKFNAKKIKKCDKAEIETLDTDAAKDQCRKAKVGKGESVVSCIIDQQGNTVELPGSVVAFNGADGTKKKPELLLHAYTPTPTGAITTVLDGTLKGSPLGGDFGRRLSIPVEPLGGGLCAIKEFEAKVKKTTRVERNGKTKKYRYVSASCSDSQKQWDVLGTFKYRANPYGVEQLVPTADQKCKRA